VRCIFCKGDSSLSKSVEHIIPESLGNSKLTLPIGTVCDSCNNYFATHIEKQILESGEFTYLRFNQELKNKRGRIPEVDILFGDNIVKAHRFGKLDFAFRSEDFAKIEKYLSTSCQGEMKIPISGKPPNELLVSRWLAKMALEMLAYKCLKVDGLINYIIEHQGLDPIRKFARAPRSGQTWTYSKRRIYNADKVFIVPDEQKGQMIYECDILATGTADSSEYYFVVAIFGIEYAINIGGDSMDGYHEWLKRHDGMSPLQIDKCAVQSADS